MSIAPNPAPDSPPPSAGGARSNGRRQGWFAGRWPRALFAPRCVLCGTAPGDPVCTGCATDFLPTDVHRCRICALRLGPATGDLCGRCLRDPPAFDETFALADYAAPVDGLVIALKFGHRLEVARVLGELVGRMIARHAPEDALLVAVPLAFERQRERGFNQALEIARSAATVSRRALLAKAVRRTRHRPAQEGLTLEERRRNVRGAFVVAREVEGQLAGRTIVVVDDVMTSGSTLDEVARELRRAGATRIVNAVVARTP